MKIVLEHGNHFYVQVCDFCKCKFLYENIDTSLLENIDSNPRTYSEKVKCPECGHNLKPSKIKYNSENILGI